MKNNFSRCAALAASAAALVWTAPFARAASDAWTQDFESAKRQAVAEHKDLLIDFTGSDWCVWCMKLDKEVFDTPGFMDKAKEKFVTVQLDYPKDLSKQPDFIQAQNRTLLGTYPVGAYPTILLCDETGAPYAATGYQEGGPEKYLESLNKLREKKGARDEAFARAEKLEGVAKAKELVAALDGMELDEKMVAANYMTVAGQIKKADPSDETGFAAKEAQQVKLAAFQRSMGQKQGNFEGTLQLVADTLADPATKGEFRQMVHGYEAATYAYAKKFPEAITVLEKAIAEDPDGKRTEELKNFIEILKKEAARKDEAPKNASGEGSDNGDGGNKTDEAPKPAEEKKAGE